MLYSSTACGTSRRSPSRIHVQCRHGRLVVDHRLRHPVRPAVQSRPEPPAFGGLVPDLFVRSSNTKLAFGYLLTRSVIILWRESLIRNFCLPLVSSSFLARFLRVLDVELEPVSVSVSNESWMCSTVLVGMVTGWPSRPLSMGVQAALLCRSSGPPQRGGRREASSKGLPRTSGAACLPSAISRQACPLNNQPTSCGLV